MSRRKRRVTSITPGRVEYADNFITLTEYRGGVEHVVRVRLGNDIHHVARDLARAGRSHVAAVVERRAQAWRWANESLTELGGGAK